MKPVFIVLCVAIVVQLAAACPTCVYTQGYWSTHGPNGNATYDATWDKVTDDLCGLYPFLSVLNNQACMLIGSQHWCNVGRQYVAMQLNAFQEDCSNVTAFGFSPELLGQVQNASVELCNGDPMAFDQRSDLVTAFTNYNEGSYPNGPCHCGDSGCDEPQDPEPECRLVCECDVIEPPSNGGPCTDYCALTLGYWKTHVGDWPIDNPTLCNFGFGGIWAEPVAGSKWLILAHQAMAALFNAEIAPGTECVPSQVQADIQAAFAFLNAHCDRVLTAAQEQQAVQLATSLDAFNNGLVGDVPHCVLGPNSGGGGNTTSPEEGQCANCRTVLDCCPSLPPPPPAQECGCTLTQGYWMNHVENWPNAPQHYSICNIDGLTILETPPAGGNAWYILAHQLIASVLNGDSGACALEHVTTAQGAAYLLLEATCTSIPPQHPAHGAATTMGDLLASYNEGDEGVPHCGDKSYQNSTCPQPCPPVPPHTCTSGCTLTQGYWKTHEEKWPQQWQGAQLCGVSWIVLLIAPPEGGDAKMILAHQYFAAVLNVASGACTTGEVDAALQTAANLLNQCDDSLFEKRTATRAQAIQAAMVLANYNEGLIGPGHCDIVPSNKRSSTGENDQVLESLILRESADNTINGEGGGGGVDHKDKTNIVYGMTIAILVIAAAIFGIVLLVLVLRVWNTTENVKDRYSKSKNDVYEHDDDDEAESGNLVL